MTQLQSHDITLLAVALVKAQSEFQPALKSSLNPHFKSKYADLSTVWEVARPVLVKHGLAVIQAPDVVEGKQALRTTVLHTSGQWISSLYLLNPVKQDPQGQGSAMTYARRYSLSSMLGIVSEDDDDGNAASKGSAAALSTQAYTPGAAAAPGVTTLTLIHSTSQPYRVEFEDGSKGSFFDDALLVKVLNLGLGAPVIPTFTQVVKGGKTFTNLTDIAPAV